MISDRMKKGEAFYLAAMHEENGGLWHANAYKEIWCDMAERYERLLAEWCDPVLSDAKT